MSVKLVVFYKAGTTVKDKSYLGLAFQQAIKGKGYPQMRCPLRPLIDDIFEVFMINQ